MLRQITTYQQHQDTLFANLEATLNILDTDILKQAVRQILTEYKVLVAQADK